jgi:hypothetical protein
MHTEELDSQKECNNIDEKADGFIRSFLYPADVERTLI